MYKVVFGFQKKHYILSKAEYKTYSTIISFRKLASIASNI